MTNSIVPHPPLPLVRLAAVFGLSVLGGLVFGVLAGLLGQVIYLLFVFPLAIGIAEGALLAKSVRRWGFAKPRLALLAGVLMGLITYTAMHFTSYMFFLGSMRDLIVQQFGATDPGQQGLIIDQLMAEQTGQPGFLGYLLFRASNGISIGRLFGGSTTTLSTPLTWLFWLAEATVLAGLPGWLARDAAREPFCTGCGKWYSSRHLGSVPDQRAVPFLDMLRAGDFGAAGGELLQDYSSTPSLEVYAQQCPGCTRSPAILTVNRATENARGTLTSQQVLQRTVAHENSAELERAARARV